MIGKNKVRAQITFSKATYDVLERISKESGASKSAIVGQAIYSVWKDKYINNNVAR